MSTWNAKTLSREQLEDLYIRRRLSIAQIAKNLGVSTTPVHRQLKKYKIRIRTLGQAHEKIYASKEELRY